MTYYQIAFIQNGKKGSPSKHRGELNIQAGDDMEARIEAARIARTSPLAGADGYILKSNGNVIEKIEDFKGR